MILSTTESIQGKTISQYHGLVFGEVIAGVNFFKDIGAGLRNILADAPKVTKRKLQKRVTKR